MTKSELAKEYQKFKTAVERSFLEAATQFPGPFNLKGREHDHRVAVSSKIGRIISKLNIPRVQVATGGPKGRTFYPYDIVCAAEAIMRDKYGYPGLEEHKPTMLARFALNEEKNKKKLNNKKSHDVNYAANKDPSKNKAQKNLQQLLEEEYRLGVDYFLPQLILASESWHGDPSISMVEKIAKMISEEKEYSHRTHEIAKIFLQITKENIDLFYDYITDVYKSITTMPSNYMLILMGKNEHSNTVSKIEELLGIDENNTKFIQ